MGWLWTTAAASPNSDEHTAQQNKTEHVPDSPLPPPPPLSRDEVAEKELQSFLKELDADIHASSRKYNRVTRSPPTTTSPSPSSQSPSTTSPNTPLSEQLLPTTMSCRTAFDEAFYCNSFGGRFNDLYRYGNLKSCSDNWNNFWFCMRTRGFGDEQKAKAIREHYRTRENTKYAKESSEDVWKSRDKKMEWGEAFSAPYEEFDGSDDEWRKKEREYRYGKVDGSMG